MKRLALLLACVALLMVRQAGLAQEQDRQQLEKDLAKQLSNSRLHGFYTIEGHQGPPQPDEYRLGKVQKAEGDKWSVDARVNYHNKVLNVPLEVPILWAGDTPVISLTNFTIPGLGTYTARVLIYEDHYVGTWSAGPHHGGSLWGRITHDQSGQTETGSKQ